MTEIDTRKIHVGRLAFRHEGSNWNCYWSRHQSSVDDALFLGSLSMRFAVVPKHKQAFISLMRSVFETAVKDALGVKPEWGEPRPAPENERSGNA